MASPLLRNGLGDPLGNCWVAVRQQGLLHLVELVDEGQLTPRDLSTLLVLASHQQMRTASVPLSLEKLRKLLRLGAIAPLSHSVRRLRALGLVARVGGERGRGYYVVNPLVSSRGNLRERQHHEKLFQAALKQQAPIRPATPGDVAARHALPCQLPAAA